MKSLDDDEAKKEELAKRLFISFGVMMTGVTMCVPTRAPMVLQIKKGNAAATAKAMGAMSAVAALIELVLNPVIGKLSDEHGRKTFMTVCPLVSAFLHTLVAAFPLSLPIQFIDRMISGAMIFGFMAPTHAALADLFASNPKKLGGMIATSMQYFGVGCTVGPFIGSKLGGARSFFLSALVFVATSLYVNMNVEETLLPEKKRKFKLSDINPVSFIRLFKERTLGWLTATEGLLSFGDYVNVYDINNLFMIKVLNYGPPQIGNFATAVGVTQIFGGKTSAEIIKRSGLKFSTAFSNFMWMLGMAMMGTARNTSQAFLALAIWTFGHNRATPVATYMQKYGDKQKMGRAEIIASSGNFKAYIKVMIPLLYSNLFAWATSGGRNMPGLPYFVICGLTALAQVTFKIAAPSDEDQ